jgi:DNA invertase Pin-like site-specific DNA recombinase
VVRRLDRLGRSLRHLIDTIMELEAQGIGFKSLQEQIDTTSSGGKLIFHIFGSLAEFEREVIKERTQAGLEAARARGRVGGRPKALSKGKAELARRMYADKNNSVSEICRTLGITRQGSRKRNRPSSGYGLLISRHRLLPAGSVRFACTVGSHAAAVARASGPRGRAPASSSHPERARRRSTSPTPRRAQTT